MVRKAATDQQQSQLFNVLAEQVKTPFIQIKHAAELSLGTDDITKRQKLLESIEMAAAAALDLIDGYNLSISLAHQQHLELEPVALGSVLFDTAHRLEAYAKAYGCSLEIAVNGKYGPVMARKDVVEAALLSMGYSFIEASSAKAKRTIILSLRKNPKGISAGIFSNLEALSSGLLKQARSLKGKARQPFKDLAVGSGAGIFVADALFESINSDMRVARLKKMQGLAVTLTPSRQLSLV